MQLSFIAVHAAETPASAAAMSGTMMTHTSP